MTTTYTTRIEQDAYIRGLEARAEAQRIMATPAYRAGDPAAHAKVRQHFLDAYPDEVGPVGTALGPGQVPPSPFGRRE